MPVTALASSRICLKLLCMHASQEIAFFGLCSFKSQAEVRQTCPLEFILKWQTVLSLGRTNRTFKIGLLRKYFISIPTRIAWTVN